VTLRPALAIVVFGAAVLLLGREPLVDGSRAVPVQQGGTAVVDDGEDVRAVRVRFRLDAPSASSVSLVGGFTGWQPTVRLRQEAPGVWSAVVPLEPGVHDYAFVIDGSEWVLDPLAQRVNDGFGGQNSRVAVLVRGGRS
jgi:1,4-alpha-glucan branching enzyme